MARLTPAWADAALALALLLPPVALGAGWPLARLVEAFELRGFTVLGDHPRCAERGLFGLYLRESQRIVVCPRGNRADTLLHEGWHAVQSRCRRGAPLLGEDALRRGLSRHDQRDLAVLYGGDRWRREAEARVMARQDPAAYFRLVDAVCTRPSPSVPEPAPIRERDPWSRSIPSIRREQEGSEHTIFGHRLPIISPTLTTA
jgi:hypothetical protein